MACSSGQVHTSSGQGKRRLRPRAEASLLGGWLLSWAHALGQLAQSFVNHCLLFPTGPVGLSPSQARDQGQVWERWPRSKETQPSYIHELKHLWGQGGGVLALAGALEIIWCHLCRIPSSACPATDLQWWALTTFRSTYFIWW